MPDLVNDDNRFYFFVEEDRYGLDDVQFKRSVSDINVKMDLWFRVVMSSVEEVFDLDCLVDEVLVVCGPEIERTHFPKCKAPSKSHLSPGGASLLYGGYTHIYLTKIFTYIYK